MLCLVEVQVQPHSAGTAAYFASAALTQMRIIHWGATQIMLVLLVINSYSQRIVN